MNKKSLSLIQLRIDPTGVLTINKNGKYDVTRYNEVIVDIPIHFFQLQCLYDGECISNHILDKYQTDLSEGV